MDFKKIRIKKLSAQALSKLRRGLPARVMAGEGMQLAVMPHQFDLISRAFLKNKGLNLSLTAPEIEMNTVEGEGIFGKKVDKALKKAGVKKIVYKTGAALKPLAMEAIDAAAVAATAYGVPPSVVALAQKETKGYLDNPDKYQTKKGQQALLKRVGSTALEAGSPYLAEAGIDVQQVKDASKLARSIKKASPGGAPAPSAASLRGDAEEAFLSTLQAYMDRRASAPAATPMRDQAPRRAIVPFQGTSPYDLMDRDGIIGNGVAGKSMIHRSDVMGNGLYAGSASGRGIGMGMYSGMGMMSHMKDVGKKYVNTGRKMVGMGHPAIESQALDANFLSRNQFPPSYQRM